MSLTQRRSGWLRWHSQFTLPRTVGREPVTAHSPLLPRRGSSMTEQIVWPGLSCGPSQNSMQCKMLTFGCLFCRVERTAGSLHPPWLYRPGGREGAPANWARTCCHTVTQSQSFSQSGFSNYYFLRCKGNKYVALGMSLAEKHYLSRDL